MTSDEIWTNVYEKGHENGVETLPFELKQLWHYIYFTYYVDNGGSTEFLYNKSPIEDERSNFFQPYIKSWKFFELLELVSLVKNYNDIFLEAVKEYNKNGKKDFYQYERKFKIDELTKELDTLIIKVVWTDKNSKVWNWINENSEQLQQQLQAVR
jgi:hypothetical protein